MKTHSSPAWMPWISVWLWVDFIFASIPLARKFQEWVTATVGRDKFLVPVALFILLGAGWAVLSVLRDRRGYRLRRLLVLGLCAAAFSSWTWHLKTYPEEALHFIEYGVLSLIALRAYREGGRAVSLDTLRSALFCIQIGALDETLQWMVPRRYFDFRDILLNAGAAVIMMVAIQWGLRAGPVGEPRSRDWRAVHRSVGRTLLIFFVLLNLTPSLLYTLRNVHSAFEKASRNPSTASEYGFLHELEGIGKIKSRLTLEELKTIDRDLAPRNAEILDGYHGVDSYSKFQKDWPPGRDPFIHEMRVHLFAREFHRHRTWEGKRKEMPENMFRNHVRTAHFEQKVLETVFPETLKKSRYHLSSGEVERLGEYFKFEPDFVSRVSQKLITRADQTQVNAMLALAGLWWLAVRIRMKEKKDWDE